MGIILIPRKSWITGGSYDDVVKRGRRRNGGNIDG